MKSTFQILVIKIPEIQYVLTLSWRWSLSYNNNQSINLHCKSMDWFVYDRDLCHERVNVTSTMKQIDIGYICLHKCLA